MSDLHDMIRRFAQPGQVDWIGLRPARGAKMVCPESASISEAGLEGDRSRGGKRAVTLIQSEHMAAIASFLGRDVFLPEELRRNLSVRSLNLSSLKNREFQVGAAVLRLTSVCAPCSLMERLHGHGGYAAVRGHGGWCAEVVRPGRIALGDPVHPVD